MRARLTARAGADDEQTCWRAAQQVTVAEVAVLGNHDPVLGVGEPGDLRIGRAVLPRKIQGVDRAVTGLVQMACEPSWKLYVDEELHAAPSGTRRMPAVLAPNSRAASRSSRSRSG